MFGVYNSFSRIAESSTENVWSLLDIFLTDLKVSHHILNAQFLYAAAFENVNSFIQAFGLKNYS